MTHHFQRCTPSNPCPICGKSDKCRVSPSFENIEVAACTKVSEGAFRTKETASGLTEHYHRLKDRPRDAGPPHAPTPRPAPSPLADADADKRHAVYSRILTLAGLSDQHREDNQARRLNPVKLAYGTLPTRDHQRTITDTLVKDFPVEVLRTIPGILVSQDKQGNPFVKLNHFDFGKPCLLVPCRDHQGRIIALRIRNPEHGAEDRKWTSLSGGKHGDKTLAASVGSPFCWSKVPKAGGNQLKTIIVTEGERKADTIAAFHDAPGVGVLSLPGVGSWHPDPLVRELTRFPGARVHLGLDSDQSINPAVAKAVCRLADTLRAAGIPFEVLNWSTEFKGADDALLAGEPLSVLTGPKADEHLARLKVVATMTREQIQRETNPPKAPKDEQDGRPVVNLKDPEELILDQCLSAMVEDPVLFVKGGRIVVPTSTQGKKDQDPFTAVGDMSLTTATAHLIAARLVHLVKFIEIHHDKKTGTDFEKVKGCPKWVAERIHAVAGAVGFTGGPRSIIGLLHGPTLDHDGRLINAPGYCQIRGEGWYMSRPVPGLTIPERPTLEQCKTAAGRIWQSVRFFEWRGELDYPKWLCALFAAVLRPLFGTCPLFMAIARGPGNGKSYLVRGVGLIAYGTEPPMATWPTDDRGREDELRKRLAGLLNGGQTIATLDNVPDGLEMTSPVLCAFLTATTFEDRLLGKNDGQKVGGVNRLVLLASGNNISPAGDLSDRTLDIDLESSMENPRLRPTADFGEVGDFIHYLKDPTNHRDLIAAVLTIARGFIQAGRPPQPGANWGSFGEFVQTVVDPVRWVTGKDPLRDRAKVLSDDPKQTALAAIMTSWLKEFTTEKWLSPGGLLRQIENNSDLELLRDNLGTLGKINTAQGLGRLLKRYVGRRKTIDGTAFAFCSRTNSDSKNSEYALKKIEKKSNQASLEELGGGLPDSFPVFPVLSGVSPRDPLCEENQEQEEKYLNRAFSGKKTGNTRNTVTGVDLEYEQLVDRVASWDRLTARGEA